LLYIVVVYADFAADGSHNVGLRSVGSGILVALAVIPAVVSANSASYWEGLFDLFIIDVGHSLDVLVSIPAGTGTLSSS